MWAERLAEHLKDRTAQLEESREGGKKIIGYFPGDYVPEELIVAAGAVPLCLISAGDASSLEASLTAIPNLFCPFARAQVGEKLLKRDPYYRLVDMLVAPITCQHLKKTAEIWEYHGDVEVFKLGVPHQHGHDFELEYYTDRLKVLRERLEAFTGKKITDEAISEAIELYNRLRRLLRQISELRRAPSPPVSTLDFVKLNHASFCADPAFMVEILEEAFNDFSQRPAQPAAGVPRLLLIGPCIGQGDYRTLELINDTGGEVVIEEVCEGIRYYWHEISRNGDPLTALAAGYLKDRVPPAFLRYSTRARLDFAMKLIKEFDVSGVIWYELLGCETYDSESYYFDRELGTRNIPMLILESDYGTTGVGQVGTRLEAFIEMVRGGPEL